MKQKASTGGMKGVQEVNTQGQARVKAYPPPFEPSAQAHLLSPCSLELFPCHLQGSDAA